MEVPYTRTRIADKLGSESGELVPSAIYHAFEMLRGRAALDPARVRGQTLWLIVSIALVSLLPHPAGAQSVVRVLDPDSIPIPFAMVSLGKAVARASDAAGTVRFKSALAMTAKIEVQRIGYKPFNATVARSTDGTYVVLMQPIPRGIDTVRTIAARETSLSRTGFYDRMDRVHNGAISGEFITPEELASRNATQISQMLQARRSVSVGTIVDGMRRRAVIKGRGGGCAMTILLDGVRINGMLEDPSSNAPTSLRALSTSQRDVGHTSIDELAAAQEIMGIEIYGSTANAPAELIPLTGGGSCGIVALWTGPRH